MATKKNVKATTKANTTTKAMDKAELLQSIKILNGVSYNVIDKEKNPMLVNGYAVPKDIKTHLSPYGEKCSGAIARAYYCHLDKQELEAFTCKVNKSLAIVESLRKAIAPLFAGCKDEVEQGAMAEAIAFLFSKAQGDFTLQKAEKKCLEMQEKIPSALLLINAVNDIEGVPTYLEPFEKKTQKAKQKKDDVASFLAKYGIK